MILWDFSSFCNGFDYPAAIHGERSTVPHSFRMCPCCSKHAHSKRMWYDSRSGVCDFNARGVPSPPPHEGKHTEERSKDAKRRNDIAWGVNPRYGLSLMRALKGRCDGFAKSYAEPGTPRPFRAQPSLNGYLGFTPQAVLCRRFAALTCQVTYQENGNSVKFP